MLSAPLSAFAAARLAKLSKTVAPEVQFQQVLENDQTSNAASPAQVPYESYLSDASSDAESDVPSIIIAPPPRDATPIRLSTFRRKNVKTDEDQHLTVTLDSDETITCVGEYDLEVLHGIATIYGTVLHPNLSPRRVYAPSTHALPSVTSRRKGTVVKLCHVKSSIRNLERLSPLFRNLWTKDDDTAHTFTPLQSTADDELQRSLVRQEVSKEAEAVFARLAAEVGSTARLSRIMAVGAKSSGKSTFNRTLCNTLLSTASVRKIVYLDLDPGQPEFGPPGQISLVEGMVPILGPPFTHAASARSSQYRVLRSHTIAATSFKDDPAHYAACAADLVQHADRQHPLIVNSCGWVSGLGATVLLDLAQALSITQLVLMEPLDAVLGETLRSSCNDVAFHSVGRQPARPTSRTPAESRSMQTLAYFHHRSKQVIPVPVWSHLPISNWRPWVVGYDGDGAGIQTILSYGTSPHPDFLSEVLDGSLVAIVKIDKHHKNRAYKIEHYTQTGFSSAEPDTADLSLESGLIQRTKDGLPYLPPSSTGANAPLDPRFSRCIGLALVRAVDPTTKTVHLITSLAGSEISMLLDEAVALVRGSFDAPDWAYLEDLVDGQEQGSESRLDRPWVSRTEVVGIEGAVWRLRHPPMPGDVR